MNYKMSLLLLGTGFLSNIVAKPAIPTREEQANVLLSVEEVFKQVQNLVQFEGTLTDQSAVEDLQKIISRAQDKLCLVEELALLKLTCISSVNSVCNVESKPKIQKIIRDGHIALDQCVQQAVNNVSSTSTEAMNMTEKATARGQSFLDTLSGCSIKSGLQQISCYRKIMLQDVVPVKTMLVEAISTHKDCHKRVIDIRNRANDCVDGVMVTYQADVALVLANSLKCK